MSDFLKNIYSDIIRNITKPDFRGFAAFLTGRMMASLTQGDLLGQRIRSQNSENLYKYIVTMDSKEEMLFNLSADSSERLNLYEAEAFVTEQLRRTTFQMADKIKSLAPQVSESDIEALRSLGYVE